MTSYEYEVYDADASAAEDEEILVVQSTPPKPSDLSAAGVTFSCGCGCGGELICFSSASSSSLLATETILKSFTIQNLNLNPLVIPLNPPGYQLEVQMYPFNYFAGFFSRRVYDDPRKVIPRDVKKYKFTVVFDMDETLLRVTLGEHDPSKGEEEVKCYFRPYAKKILKALKTNYPEIELILWSAGTQQHVERCLTLLDPEETIFSHVICRGSSWVNIDKGSAGVIKDLGKLRGRPENTILIFDDSVMASIANPTNAVIIPAFNPFFPGSERDTTLLYILQIIVRNYILLFEVSPITIPKCYLASSDMCSNTKYLRKNPYISVRRIQETSHQFFVLDANDHSRMKYRVKRFYRLETSLLVNKK